MAEFSLPKGVIKRVTSGREQTEVVIVLPEGEELVTVFSNSTMNDIKPEEGNTAYAFVSDGRVMLLTDSRG